MEITKKMIEIMSAYVNGKTIEYKEKGSNGEWSVCKDPCWCWDLCDYRVQEKVYRPYESFDEFHKDWEKHGGWAKDDRDCSYVMLHMFKCSFAECLNVHYTWADDGTPCGVRLGTIDDDILC